MKDESKINNKKELFKPKSENEKTSTRKLDSKSEIETKKITTKELETKKLKTKELETKKLKTKDKIDLSLLIDKTGNEYPITISKSKTGNEILRTILNNKKLNIDHFDEKSKPIQYDLIIKITEGKLGKNTLLKENIKKNDILVLKEKKKKKKPKINKYLISILFLFFFVLCIFAILYYFFSEYNSMEISMNNNKYDIEEIDGELTDLKNQIIVANNKNDSLTIIVQDIVNGIQNIEAVQISCEFYDNREKFINNPAYYIYKIDEVRVSFTLMENQFAKKGLQKIYLKIYSEQNEFEEVWTNDENNTNNNFFTPQGERIYFTKEETIDYQCENQSYTISWKREKYKISKGDYYIILYSENKNLIGETKFSIN